MFVVMSVTATEADILGVKSHILAEGTLSELQERHHERDLEELFFGLISQHDEARANSELVTS